MSIFDVEKYLPDPTKSFQENQIQALYHGHWKTYIYQMRMIEWNIITWRERAIESIRKYAEDQQQLLQEGYYREKNRWIEKLQDTLETTQYCIMAQNDELFNEVLAQCQKLEYQVAQLENIRRDMLFPVVLTEEEQRKKMMGKMHQSPKNDELSATIPSNTSTDSRSTEKAPVLSSKSSPLPDESCQPELAMQSTSKDSSRAKHQSSRETPISTKDGSYAGCTVCFMLFPPEMSHDDQDRHMLAHWTYD